MTLTVPLRVAVASWAVVLVLGGVLAVLLPGLLPPRFSYDAGHIAQIARTGMVAGMGDKSFTAVGEFYNILGLQKSPLLTAVVSYAAIGLLTTGVLLRTRSEGRLAVLVLVALTVSLGIGTVYLTTYSKDAVVLLVTATCLLVPADLVGEIVLVAGLSLYALCFRDYWALVAVAYIAIRLTDRFASSRWIAFLVPLVLVVALAACYPLLTGQVITYARTLANASRLGSPDAHTAIVEYLPLIEPWGSIANTALTLVLLIVPVPLLLRGGAYYVGIALLFMTLWGAVGTAWLRRPRVGPRAVWASRALAVLLAFLTTQAIFEPDYGSALRHLSPLLPLVALGIGLALAPQTEAPAARRLRGRHSA